MKKKKELFLSVLMIAGLISCTDLNKPDSFKTKDEIDYENAWNETIGSVDPEHTWAESMPVSIEVSGAGNAQISIYTIGEAKRVLLARETVSSSATIEFEMPLGIEKGIAICRETSEGTEYRSVGKASLMGGKASVSFAEMGTKADFAPISDANREALTQPTLRNQNSGQRAKIWGYSNFPAWIWYDMNAAIPENKSAVVTKQITNFEMQSNGLFYISTIYGSTGVDRAEIGYYYYDTVNPSDTTMVPLVDALAADYYYDEIGVSREEALAKVLWLDKSSWQWTPANFCYYDKVSGMASSAFKTRQNDNQFNTLSILQTYGNEDPELNGIAQVKGLTFQIDAPKGNMVGFYCKRPSYTNHSTTSFNRNGKPRAAIKVYDGFRFIGLEDGSSDGGNEPDCNDIAFVMVPGNDGILPGLLLPYIKDNDSDKFYNGDGTLTDEPKYDVATDGPDPMYEDLASRKQIWTVAFEDMSTIGDFDFNDVVLTIVPADNKRSADIYLCATGGSINANLYYKDEYIGEAHQLLGSVENGKNVIANTYSQKYAIKKIYTIDWHPGHRVDDEAKNFKVIAGKNVITLPEKGEIPKALCVPGFWAWPKESTRIDLAYPRFADWAYDGKNDNHANWYNRPEEDKVVRF
ncbi:MAG: LruC domain-containing protein [Candidatus Cryptobacteroides sp.]